MRPYSPGGTLNALAPARRGSIPRTPSVHRLLPGLQGYLIPFAPLAFVPQRQLMSRNPPSPRVFLSISTHFTATPRIPVPPPYSSLAVSCAVRGLSPRLSHTTYETAYARFTPSDSEQRLRPLYYRGCWHRVSRLFLLWYYLFNLLPHDRGLQSEDLHSPTRRRTIRVSPIVNDSRLLPPVGVWTVSQFQCGRTSSQTGYPSSPW